MKPSPRPLPPCPNFSVSVSVVVSHSLTESKRSRKPIFVSDVTASFIAHYLHMKK